MEHFESTQNRGSFLLAINALIVMCMLSLVMVAMYMYARDVRMVVEHTNRYVTTEWHLFQELKAQTDRKLYQKDLEISQLRAEYMRLLGDQVTGDEIRQIEIELKKAEQERADILAQRLAPETYYHEEEGTSDANVGERYLVTDTSQLREALGDRIRELEEQLDLYRTLSETSQPSLTALSAEDILKREEVLRQVENKMAELSRLPPARLESIRTRSFLRALVSSPEKRNEYPNLLDELDRTFDDFGRQEWVKGQLDAYRFVSDILKAK